MAEYITKQQVLDWFAPYGMTGDNIPYDVLAADLRIMAAADVAPVRHGRWIHKNSPYDENIYVCTACKEQVSILGNKPRYCLNCGAIMEGGDGDA